MRFSPTENRTRGCVSEQRGRKFGFARDDKGEGSAHLSSRYSGWTEPQPIRAVHLFECAQRSLITPSATLSATSQLLMEAPLSPLSSRPKRSGGEGPAVSLNPNPMQIKTETLSAPKPFQPLANSHGNAPPTFVIPTEAKRRGGTCSFTQPQPNPNKTERSAPKPFQPLANSPWKRPSPLCHPERSAA
jgi:hypothetical protein